MIRMNNDQDICTRPNCNCAVLSISHDRHGNEICHYQCIMQSKRTKIPLNFDIQSLDRKAEVLKIYPDAVCVKFVGKMPDKPPTSIKYFIQRDGRMKFTDCEEDSDFLTPSDKQYDTESDAWEAAYKIINNII